MEEKTGVRFIVGRGIDLNDIPVKSMIYNRRTKKEFAAKKSTSASTPVPAPVTTSLYGFKIQPIKGLGEHGKPDPQSFWRTILGALQTGSGFEIPKKDFGRARKAVNKYNKEAKKIWKQDRKFILEVNIDANGEIAAGIGRVGRLR